MVEARPLAGLAELLAPCFFVEVHRPGPQLRDTPFSTRISGEPRAPASLVSWGPATRTEGLGAGAAAIAWP